MFSSSAADSCATVCCPPKSLSHQNCPSPQLDVSLFSADQVAFVCQCLENCANFSALTFFLERMEKNCGGSLACHPARDVLHRAKALSLFHCRQFGELYAFIQRGRFASSDHALLQRLWNEAHYAEVEHLRGKQLDPVSRYRIRKKNAFPRSIWDGESTSYCFKKSARQILRETYRRQKMPSQEEKVRLARMTQLSTVQVSNWFKNQRQRTRQNGQKHKSDQKHLDRSSNIWSSYESDGMESEETQQSARSDERRRENGGRKWPWEDDDEEEEDDPLLTEEEAAECKWPLPEAKMPFRRSPSPPPGPFPHSSSAHFHRPSIVHLAAGDANEKAMKWKRKGRTKNSRRTEEFGKEDEEEREGGSSDDEGIH